jgi:hypothetical protein
MGKETQFARAEVAPVVAKSPLGSSAMFGDRCHQKIRDGFKRNSLRTIRLPQLA